MALSARNREMRIALCGVCGEGHLRALSLRNGSTGKSVGLACLPRSARDVLGLPTRKQAIEQFIERLENTSAWGIHEDEEVNAEERQR